MTNEERMNELAEAIGRLRRNNRSLKSGLVVCFGLIVGICCCGLRSELENRVRAELKNAVMDQLIEKNPIDVPAAIVRQEAETLRKQTAAQMPGAEQPVEAYMDDATRRVKLGLILAQVVKTAAIQPDAEKVRQRVESMSKDYEDPDEFVRYYQSNPQLLRGIETLVMEDMVVDWIVDQAEVSETERSFDDLMNVTKKIDCITVVFPTICR